MSSIKKILLAGLVMVWFSACQLPVTPPPPMGPPEPLPLFQSTVTAPEAYTPLKPSPAHD